VSEFSNDVSVTIKRHKSGSRGTRAARWELLKAFSKAVGEQFHGLRLTNINKKHLDWYVERIKGQPSARTGRPLSTGRQKNILSAIRWLLEQTGKANLLPSSNADLGIQRRIYVGDSSKAIDTSDELLDEIAKFSEYVAASLRLSREFGLRIEESIKVRVIEADLGNELKLQDSWCKGGVPRSVPVRTSSQRDALDFAHRVSAKKSLCPDGLSYIEHARVFRNLVNRFGIHRVHGLRHAYAQKRYCELTGWAPPVNGGPLAATMTPAQFQRDRAARMTVSNELGHGRVCVTNVYLGSATLVRKAMPDETSTLID
jgi:Integrase